MVAWQCWDTPHDLDVVLRPVRRRFKQIVFCQLFLYISVLTSFFHQCTDFFYSFLASLGTVGNQRKIYALDVLWISSVCLYCRQQSGQIWHHLFVSFSANSFELIILLLLFSTFSSLPCQGSSSALSLFLVCSSFQLHQFPSKWAIISLPLLFGIISIFLCFFTTVHMGIFMHLIRCGSQPLIMSRNSREELDVGQN